jgi:transcriptional regulator with XRE-family HTH domain
VDVLFGDVLREFRKRSGLTQEALAEASGYHPTYIGQLERGKKSPSLRTLIGISRAMETPASSLIVRLEEILKPSC